MSEETKKAPAIRFQGFTDDWEQRKLGDMVEFFSGLTYSPDNVIKQPGTLVLRSSNVQNGEIVNADNVYVDNEVVNSDNVQVGDIAVVVRNGSRSLIGKHAAIKYPMKDTVIGAFMTGVRSDTPSFTNALLDTQQFETEIAKNLGATINQITTGNFKKMIFNFPEIDERLRIGDFFNQLDNTIALHQRKLTLIEQLKQTYLQVMFPQGQDSIPILRFAGHSEPWEQRKLGEISESYSGGTPSVAIQSYYGGSIPFIRSAEINSKNTELYLTEEGLNNSSAKLVEEGDILYALYGATSGEVGISQINGAINQAILAIKPEIEYDSNFIMQWLRRQKMSIISTYLQGGQGNLSGSIVKDLALYAPTKQEEQTKIGSFFKQLDDTIALHQEKIAHLKVLKSTLLNKMFI